MSVASSRARQELTADMSEAYVPTCAAAVNCRSEAAVGPEDAA